MKDLFVGSLYPVLFVIFLAALVLIADWIRS